MIELSVLFDWIIKLSGWFLAVVLGAWRITDAIRYRQDIKIDVHTSEDNSKEYLEVTVINNGRRPFNIIDVGIVFSNGEFYSFFTYQIETLSSSVATSSPEYVLKTPSFWLYRRRPYHYSIYQNILKEEIKKQATTVDRIYVTQETGDDKELIIPGSIKQKLND